MSARKKKNHKKSKILKISPDVFSTAVENYLLTNLWILLQSKKINNFLWIYHLRYILVLFSLLIVISMMFFYLIFIESLIFENNLLRIKYAEVTLPPYPSVQDIINPSLTADAYIIFDKKSRVVIKNNKKYSVLPPASTAKIMTAILSLEHYKKNAVLKSAKINTVQGSKMGLVENEEISVMNLLYGLMLPSGNDAAFVLAQHFPGGKNAFIQRMNDKARELRLTNSRFVDPAGYEDENRTSVWDIVRLAAYAMENNDFKTIVATKNISVSDRSGKIIHKLTNLNELLGIPGIVGVKTGYTVEAGEVLITAYSPRKTDLYIIAVLKSTNRFEDTKKILNSVIPNIKNISYGRFEESFKKN